jgi:hypothetical protein
VLSHGKRRKRRRRKREGEGETVMAKPNEVQ